MTTINNIYLNNNEYTQMWLNGVKIWEKATVQENYLVDFTQSTAPSYPSYFTLYNSNSSYYFRHGTFTSGVYGLCSINTNVSSSTSWSCYKYVAPTSGTLTFKARCSSESVSFDMFTIHVSTSPSQPTYNSSTNRIACIGGTTYQSSDYTATKEVTQGTTYYIHLQYRKDSSVNNGYDMACLRSIELVTSGSSSGGTTEPTVTYGNIVTSLSSCSVNEGGEQMFGVRLDKAPTNNQTVTLSINSTYTTLSRTTLTFSPSHYSSYQYVTITANKDGAYTNRTETITLSSPNVSSKTITVNVTNTETQPSTTESSTIDFTTSSTLPSYATLDTGSLNYDASHCAVVFKYNQSDYVIIKYVAPKSGSLSILYDNKYCYYDDFTIAIGTSKSSFEEVQDSYASFDSTHNQTNPYQVTQGTTYYIKFNFTSGDNCEEYYSDCACVQTISIS